MHASSHKFFSVKVAPESEDLPDDDADDDTNLNSLPKDILLFKAAQLFNVIVARSQLVLLGVLD